MFSSLQKESLFDSFRKAAAKTPAPAAPVPAASTSLSVLPILLIGGFALFFLLK